MRIEARLGAQIELVQKQFSSRAPVSAISSMRGVLFTAEPYALTA